MFAIAHALRAALRIQITHTGMLDHQLYRDRVAGLPDDPWLVRQIAASEAIEDELTVLSSAFSGSAATRADRTLGSFHTAPAVEGAYDELPF